MMRKSKGVVVNVDAMRGTYSPSIGNILNDDLYDSSSIEANREMSAIDDTFMIERYLRLAIRNL